MEKEDHLTRGTRVSSFVPCDWGLLALVFLFFAMTLPIIFFGTHETIYSFDHTNYHVPAIRQIRAKWPKLDLAADSFSAIAPGYHYLLATAACVTGDRDLTLRLVNCLVSLIGPLALYCFAKRTLPPLAAFLLVLPLVTSNFFVKSSCWVVTDNASLLFVSLSLIALFRQTSSKVSSLAVGVLTFFATFVRQMNVWLTGAVLVRAAFEDKGARRMIAIAVASMPLAVLACLYFAWGGLVPSQWRESAVTSFSLCPIAYLFAVFGVLGMFYLTVFNLERWRGWLVDPWVNASAIAGLAVSFISPNTYNFDEGRWGGYLWAVVHVFPAFVDRSLFFVILSPVGSATAAIIVSEIWRAAGAKPAILWMTSLAGWMSVFLINRQVFHRYFEPTSLVFLILGVVLAAQGELVVSRRFKTALMLLTAIQLIITAATISEAFGFHFVGSLRR